MSDIELAVNLYVNDKQELGFLLCLLFFCDKALDSFLVQRADMKCFFPDSTNWSEPE